MMDQVSPESGIEVLDLVYRAYRCLTFAGIFTIADLLRADLENPSGLLDVHGFNPKLVEHVDTQLQAAGFQLTKHGN